MSFIMAFLVLALFSSLAAYWKHPIIFMITGALGLMIGLNWYNTYMNATGLTISLMLIAYALFCVAATYWGLFKGERIQDEN